MADEFKLWVEGGTLVVRHLADSHWFRFRITHDGPARCLSGDVRMRAATGRFLDAKGLLPDARAFAEREARAAGLID